MEGGKSEYWKIWTQTPSVNLWNGGAGPLHTYPKGFPQNQSETMAGEAFFLGDDHPTPSESDQTSSNCPADEDCHPRRTEHTQAPQLHGSSIIEREFTELVRDMVELRELVHTLQTAQTYQTDQQNTNPEG